MRRREVSPIDIRGPQYVQSAYVGFSDRLIRIREIPGIEQTDPWCNVEAAGAAHDQEPRTTRLLYSV